VTLDLVIAALGKEHAAVVKGSQDAAGKAENNDERVVDVWKVGRKGEAENRPHPQHLRDEKVRDDRRRHDRDDKRCAELLVDLLDCKEYARKRCVEGCGHACRGPTGDEQTLLSPPTLKGAGDCLAGHTSKLDGWSFSP